MHAAHAHQEIKISPEPDTYQENFPKFLEDKLFYAKCSGAQKIKEKLSM